jgi:hypothetical protein
LAEARQSPGRAKFAMPGNGDDALLPFSLPNICQKKVTAAFDGGLISSDCGVLLLACADLLFVHNETAPLWHTK